jgi:PEP-CTERM motif
MLRNLLISVAALSFAAPASAAFTVTFPSTQVVPVTNDYKGNLAGLGLVNFASTGATVTLGGPTRIKFELFGTESGFRDIFSTTGLGALSYQENVNGASPFGAIFIGIQDFAAGSLAGKLNFSVAGSPSGSQTATVGQSGFSVFTSLSGASGFAGNVLWFGYDDSTARGTDNHDDMIIRATILPIPEPGTWAMMIGGVGIAGMALRRRRRTASATVMA